MESANLDLEENKEIASKFERALGMGATLAELHGITPDTLEGVYAYAYNFYEKGRLDEAGFLNFSVFMISKIITI